MKWKLKLVFAIALSLLFSIKTNAQFISSLSIYPASPTENDSIYLIASCYFQAGSCNQKTLNFSIMNEIIDCDALHCIGMATYICSDQDTFSIGKLSAGNYSFHYTVNAGYGMQPCIPGIIAGPTDSTSFTVSNATGIATLSNLSFSLSPNPCKDFLDINGKSIVGSLTSIYDINGRIVLEALIKEETTSINTSELLPGAYFLKVMNSSTINTTKLFYKL